MPRPRSGRFGRRSAPRRGPGTRTAEAPTVRESAFLERSASLWERLDALLERRARAVDPLELGRLYRSACDDLAYATARGYDRRLLEYLNRLVGRAHARVYAPTLETGGSRIARFYAVTFPREVRRSLGLVAVCAALTIVAAAVAYALVTARPSDAYALLPSTLVPASIHKSLHDSNFGFDRNFSSAVSVAIIANNVRVAIVAFAGAITLGALTAYVIATNGLMLGAMAALYARAGFGRDFWATIAPHGVIELSAIQIAGGAGLAVVAGFLAPGRLRRRDAIVRGARRAGTLMLGVASMLVVAGTIEGFVSPQRWPADGRLAVGATTAMLLLLYFTLAGRSADVAGSE